MEIFGQITQHEIFPYVLVLAVQNLYLMVFRPGKILGNCLVKSWPKIDNFLKKIEISKSTGPYEGNKSPIMAEIFVEFV